MPLAVFISYYLQIGRGVPPTFSGLILLAAAVGSVSAAFFVGARSGKTGRLRRYLISGAGVLLVGAVGLALMGTETPFWYVLVALAVFGIGQGATVQFVVLAAQNTVGVNEVGAVTGFMSFMQLLGASIGLSLFTTIAVARFAALEAQGASTADAYALGVPEVFLVVAAFAAAAVVALALLPKIRLRATLDLEPPPPTGPIQTVS